MCILTRGGRMNSEFKFEPGQVLLRAMLRTAMQYITQLSYMKPDSAKLPEIKKYYTRKINGFLAEIEKLPQEDQVDVFGSLIIMRDKYRRQEIVKKRTLQFAFAKECKIRHEAIAKIFEIKEIRGQKQVQQMEK